MSYVPVSVCGQRLMVEDVAGEDTVLTAIAEWMLSCWLEQPMVLGPSL